MAQFPTKAQAAGKGVELKRRGGQEAGIGKIPTLMLGFEQNLLFLLILMVSWTVFGMTICIF